MVGRIALALAVGAALGVGAAARAGTTSVALSGSFDTSASDPHPTLDYMLGAAYGYGTQAVPVQGTGSLTTSIGWTSGANSITFTRVSDTGGSSPLLMNGSNFATASDATWGDGTPTFAVDVKMAANFETLGWHNNLTNTSQDILTANAATFGLDPSFTFAPGAPPLSLSSSFTWYDKTGPAGGSNTWSSDPSLNGGEDHMVTFWVTGKDASGNPINGGAGAYVICFEDLPFAQSDLDYQDLVVQVGEVPGGTPPPVPVPAAAWAGMGLLGAMGGARYLRRRRQV